MNTHYLDLYDNPSQLTEEEIAWFNKICKECIEATGINILIECEDHYRKCKDKSKEAHGIIWSTNVDNPLDGDCKITIDNLFIHDCYEEVFNNGCNLNFKTLEEVIAHELAHTLQWNHCKKHRAITEELYGKIKSYQANMEMAQQTKRKGR